MTKTVIVTGATSGIGRCVAEKFHENGWNVYAIGRDLDRLKMLEEKLGSERLCVFQADMGLRENVGKAVSTAVKKWKGIHAVFLGAGFGIGGNIGDKKMESAESMVKINLLGPFYLLEALTPVFREQGYGHVVGVGSVAGIKPAPGFALYSATKFALRALIESWRNEIQENGVKTTVLQPGVVDTPFWKVFSDGGPPVQFKDELTLSPSEIGAITFQIVNTPQHLSVNEITIRPSKQVR